MRTAALPATDLRDQHHFAIGAELRGVGVLEDLAVDRHGHAFLDLPRKAWEAFLQFKHQAAEGGRRNLEIRLATGEALAGGTRDQDFWHARPSPSTLSGATPP